MFQFRRFPTYAYLIQRRLTEYCSAGFPHSVICGSKLMCSSPQLIAACHDLHRLLMPRHSPCALISLTFVGADFISLASPLRRKLAHSIAPPPQFEPASLGFKLVPAGSLRIMQASVWFHCSFCTLYLKSPQNYFVTSLLLARNFLLASLFSFQGAYLQPFARSDRNARSIDQTLRFDLTGGGYRTRTGDPLLAKQVLYQLS